MLCGLRDRKQRLQREKYIYVDDNRSNLLKMYPLMYNHKKSTIGKFELSKLECLGIASE